MAKPSLPANYESHRFIDPLPSIPPALLNAYHITDYVKAVGIVSPFDLARLKPASYEVPFGGVVHWWDAKTKETHKLEVSESGDTFQLEPNAIAYIYLSTKFFLPKYIAVRFNLRITHVHQGLLLGTGPLVDPGFCGNLLVPLHNLTANPYSFTFGEGFIWVEFTKVSPFPAHDHEPQQPGGERRYGVFPESKLFLSEKQYFAKANEGRPIVSSVVETVRSIAEKADSAQKQVRFLTLGLVVSMVAAAIGIIAVVASTTQTVQTSVKYVTDSNSEMTRTRMEQLRREIQDVQTALERKYDARLESAEKAVDTLKRSASSKSGSSTGSK